MSEQETKVNISTKKAKKSKNIINNVESNDDIKISDVKLGFNDRLIIEFGHCSKQGKRKTMEDQVIMKNNLYVSESKCSSKFLSLFAVFDGHSGCESAKLAKKNMENILIKELISNNDIIKAIKNTIIKLDKLICNAEHDSGCTLNGFLIDKIKYIIYTINIGDSRSILISNNNVIKQLSIDHKPNNAIESKRIIKNGGFITNNRILGVLGVSRSLGDKMLKSNDMNFVDNTPDINIHNITKNNKFLVCACDGLFDVLSNDDIGTYINKQYNNNIDINDIATNIVNYAINDKKSKDNVSVIICKLIYNNNYSNKSNNDINNNDNINDEQKSE